MSPIRQIYLFKAGLFDDLSSWTRGVEGNSPLFMPGIPKEADFVATIMSHVRASCRPAAVAMLLTAQRVIRGNLLSLSIVLVH